MAQLHANPQKYKNENVLEENTHLKPSILLNHQSFEPTLTLLHNNTQSSESIPNLLPIFQSTVSTFTFSMCCTFVSIIPRFFYDNIVLDGASSLFVMSLCLGLYYLITMLSDEILIREYYNNRIPTFLIIHPMARGILMILFNLFKLALGVVVFAYEIKQLFKISGIVLEIDLFIHIILLGHAFGILLLFNVYFCLSLDSKERTLVSENKV